MLIQTMPAERRRWRRRRRRFNVGRELVLNYACRTRLVLAIWGLN
jgi:hypothetical protein